MSAALRLMSRAMPRAAFAAAPRLTAPAAGFALCAARRVAMPSPCASTGARAFSAVSPMVISQADNTLKMLAVAEKDILRKSEHHSWAHMEPDALDKMVESVGRCRDYCNSLSPEEAAAADAHNGVLARTDFIEDMLKMAIRCDQLSHKAHELRMEIEDLGTSGDGENHPGSFTKKWDTEVDSLFNEYADMLDYCNPAYVQRLENELGYELLLLKRVMHIDNFRAKYPRVHPSGFSASSD
mmetsp:Transcript_41403/g.80904  ORF Transcript_41403/g.80904 Transcript_41403/m.80904 type:complete len:240 (-) Transcript_41403:38-757(-)|eukprot:CAMPEP_0173377372 /NCGR_PEP_ID=MMETSP1356-20130122/574_1 /TAXON_ID=77927 ORGANISM="Hemiselmis virescens, Strain PCC157" /NCGR_SAMPLE_ID=MMETSP1356 /ASSEMBLY_ACC=CAM_ASM_000847 /LENGTH=239 /DNA_ID=CAMNT_0014330061 /DNA_START=13 /DNA_END=732 /DNA_ORIENTATION=-